MEACAQAEGAAGGDAGAEAEQGGAAVVEGHAGVEDAGRSEGEPFHDEDGGDDGLGPGDDGGFGEAGRARGVDQDGHGVPLLAAPSLVRFALWHGGGDFAERGGVEEGNGCDTCIFEVMEDFGAVL